MIKKATSLKMFLTAVATFLTVELSDSPVRTLSYLSVFAVAGGNMWLKIEEFLEDFSNRY